MSYLELIYSKIYQDFQHFIFSNNILITASGFVIGIATNDYIKKNIKLSEPIYTYISNILIPYETVLLGTKKIIFYIHSFKLLVYY